MQFMQINSFSSVDIKCIHYWHQRNCHNLHVALDIVNIAFKYVYF